MGSAQAGLIHKSYGGAVVSGDTLTAVIQKTQAVGGGGIASVGGLFQALAGSFGILQNPHAPQVAESLAVFAPQVSLPGGQLEEAEGGLGVALGAPSRKVQLTHTDTGIVDPSLGGQRDPAGGLHLQLGNTVPLLVGAAKGVAGGYVSLMGVHGGGDGLAVGILHATDGGEALGQAG
jgi:hypothetical protein